MLALNLCHQLLALVAIAAPVLAAGFDGPDLNSDVSWKLRLLILKAHNDYRRKHSAPDLVWNSTFAAPIQTGVNKCPDGDPPVVQGYSYGENWFGVTVTGPSSLNFTDWSIKGVQAWGNEGQYYNYNNPKDSGGQDVGHFTQVVWKSTTSVVCGWNQKACGAGHSKNQLLCGYYPPGNVIYGGVSDPYILYKQNVLPK